METTETQVLSDDILVTDKALSEIKRLMQENNLPDSFGLRVGIKGGGCSGLSYSLAFDSTEKPGDKVVNSNGLKIFIDGKSYFYLAGTQLDFSDGLNGRGFVFNNPNAAKTCGCGSSFGV
jgi:iron-sulfur cluster assembly protein